MRMPPSTEGPLDGTWCKDRLDQALAGKQEAVSKASDNGMSGRIRRDLPKKPKFVAMHTLLRFALATFIVSASSAYAQWQPYNSGQGAIRSITTEGSTIHMVSYPNGVFSSTNGGTTWTPSNNGLPLTNSSYFVRSVGRNATHLFAGTHSGIYRSANGGDTWAIANGTLTASSSVFANKFFQFGNTTFAVFSGTIAGGGGVHRTVDNGATWLIGHSGMGSNATVYHITASGSALYAATSVGLYKSTDNGQQWTVLPGTNFAIFSVAAVNGRLIVISTFGYRYSTNEGATWTNSSGGVANPTKGELIAFDGKLYSISGTSSGCFVSLDNGTSFIAYNDGLAPIDVVAQEQFHASVNTLYMGTFSDIYRIEGSSVGVSGDLGRQDLRLYPSPFATEFTVELEPMDRSRTLLLLDATGREVRRIDGIQGGRTTIGREGLAPGRYSVVVLDGVSGTPDFVGGLIAD